MKGMQRGDLSSMILGFALAAEDWIVIVYAVLNCKGVNRRPLNGCSS